MCALFFVDFNEMSLVNIPVDIDDGAAGGSIYLSMAEMCL
jgi:hypothetical protein